MAVSNTSDYLPTSGLAEVAQMTSSDGTSESGALITGSANGKRIKEIRVFSGPNIALPPGSILVLKLYDGTNSRVIASAVCPGGPDTLQAFFAFNNFFLTSTSYSLKAQLRTSLPSGAVLDWSFMGENF
jgi:hypothetical protein